MKGTKWMTAGDKPALTELVSELDEIAGRSGEFFARQLDAEDVRRCRWDNQSADGRKWIGKDGKAPFPWPGAADTRVRTADELVNDCVKLMRQAFFVAKLQARAVESGDMQNAQNVSTLLRWLRDVKLRTELRTEVELAAQWCTGDDPGMVIVLTLWKEDTVLEMRELMLDQVLQAAAEATGSPDAGDDLILTRELEPQALDLMSAAWPQIKRTRLRKALRELRRKGMTMLPMPTIKERRPCVKALRCFHDIFFPVGTTDLQRARIVFWREWLTEVELAERKLSSDWDGDWIEAVLEAGPGGCIARTGTEGAEWAFRSFDERQENLYEVWHALYRAHDEMGIPAVQETIFHHAVPEQWAKHGALGYPLHDYPLTLFTRERLGREITDSRGIPQIVVTQQVELKIQRDCRAAATQISTLPPMQVSKRRSGVKLVLAPAAELAVDRMDDMKWLDAPPFPNSSIEIENATRRDVDSYFARANEDSSPARSQLYAQDMLQDWLGGWAIVFAQALALMQDRMDPVEIERVTGEPMEKFTKESISGSYDLSVEVDARDMDLEFLIKKMEVVAKYVLPADSAGTFDQAGLAKEVLGAVDARWANRYVRDAGAVTLQEIEDEQTQIVKMKEGIEPPLRDRGINAELRLRVLDETVKTSPKLQEALADPDSLFARLLENRRKNLEQMVNQNRNKQIGRFGTAPVLGNQQPAATGGGY